MKKKNFKNILCAALSLTTVFSVASCGKSKDKTPSATGTVDAVQEHKATNTIHVGYDQLKDSGMPFVVNGSTDYKLTYNEEDVDVTTAAKYIVANVTSATQASIETAENAEWSESAKYIVVGNKALEAAAGLSITTDYDLGDTGYQIVTKGNSVFILANGGEGYHLGALAFLRIVVGFEYLSDDLVVYQKDGSYIPEMNIIERPDFDYRRDGKHYTRSLSTMYGMATHYTSDVFINTGWSNYHNTFYYLPPETYEHGHANCGAGLTDEECAAGHKNWYTELRCGDKWDTTHYGKDYASQLCYTARGNDEQKAIMQEIVAQKVVETALLEENREKELIMFGAQDESTNCNCDACQAVIDEYGTIGAAIVPFVNVVGEKVEEKLRAYANANDLPVKKLTILFFAYQSARVPPNKVEDELKCRDNVAVLVANSKARYSWTMYDDINKADAENLQGWAQFGKLHYWFYRYNYSNYLVPCNTFSTLAENLRFAKTYGGAQMYLEQSSRNAYSPGFCLFKDYLESRLMVDVNLEYGDLKRIFFDNYFGEGGVAMEQFFDEVTSYMTYYRDQGDHNFDGVVVNEHPDQKKYWPYQMLVRWNELCNDALKAVEKVQLTDPSAYEVYRKHIVLESMFPRYALLKWHEERFTKEELKQQRLAFYADAKAFSFSHESEEHPIAELWATWGVA